MHILLPWHVHCHHKRYHVHSVQCRSVFYCYWCDFVSGLLVQRMFTQSREHHLLQMPCKHWDLLCIKCVCELYYHCSSKPTVAMPNGER